MPTTTLTIWFCLAGHFCTTDNAIATQSFKLNITPLQCEYTDAITNVGRDYKFLAERHTCEPSGSDL